MLDTLIAVSLRVSLLCLVGVAFTGVLRQSSPILRHRIWTVVVFGSLLIPILLFIIPVIYVPLAASPAPVTQPEFPVERPRVVPTHAPQAASSDKPELNAAAPTSQQSPMTQSTQTESPDPPTTLVTSHQLNIGTLLLSFWLAGVLLMLARGVWYLTMLYRLADHSATLTDPGWLRLRDNLSARIGLRQQVKLLQSDCIDVPFTWGIRQPIILLPASCAMWTEETRRVVLLHELIHVHRRDAILNWLAWLAKVIHWFNPLIWFACQRLSVEAEHATDARLLACDVDPIHYAQLLVDFVRDASPGLVIGGTAMISETTLKARVRNILSSAKRDHTSAKPRQWFVVLSIALFIALMGGIRVVTVTAQSDEIALTVTLMAGMEYLEDARVFEQFEEANPNVRVEVTYQQIDTAVFSSSVNQIESHLDRVDTYTLSGDVLIASAGASLPPEVSLEATQAGYYLDLDPLIQTDVSFDPSLFYSTAWESVNWSGGTWLLPLAVQIYTVVYDSEAFDAAGVPYPDANWGIENYIDAIQTLAADDGASGISVPGFIGYNRSDHALIYSLLGQGVADSTSGSVRPAFTEPQTLTFAEQWGQLLTTGEIYNPLYTYSDDFTPTAIPLTTDRLQATIFSDSAAALMPGSTASIAVSGFAVSSRTEHPEAAYQLALYLVNDVRVADALVTQFSMTTSARPTYDERDDIENAPFSLGELSEENQLLLERAIESAVPVSELLLFDYFLSGLRQAINANGNVQAVLEEAQVLAQDNLQFASERRSEITGSVITSTQSAELQPGEIALRFGLDSTTIISNPNAWERFIAEFIEADAEVGEVILDSRSINIERAVESYDCFYLPFNAVSIANLDTLVNFDPLTSADPAFDPNDLWPGVLQQVEREGQTWAYPIGMYPLLVWYDESLAASEATIQEVYNILDTQLAQRSDEPVMVAANLGITLLMLMAADGGLPIDFRQSPPVIDFTGHLPSIRRVLDLAKSGAIHYEPLTSFTGFDAPPMPLITVRPWNLATSGAGGYVPAPFPRGDRYTPIAFELGTAYISRFAPNPEACYRFISMMSQRPDLFTGIPVQYASVDAQRGEFQALIPELETVLAGQETVIFPYSIRGGAARDVILSYWLHRAFDRYVLDDANLDAEIAEAERFSQEYLTCTDNLSAYDPAIQSSRERNQQYVACALQVDPTSQAYFSFGR